MHAPNSVKTLELALIRLEYAVADFNYRAASGKGAADCRDLETLLAALLTANRLVQDKLAAARDALESDPSASRSPLSPRDDRAA